MNFVLKIFVLNLFLTQNAKANDGKTSDLIDCTLNENLVRKLDEDIIELRNANNDLNLRLLSAQKGFDEQNEIWKNLNDKFSSTVETQNNVDKKDKNFPRNCAEALAQDLRSSGIQSIKIDFFSDKPFLVYCDQDTKNGNWTVIQRRLDGSVDFFRNWAEYKNGFGNLEKEFFIGLDKLHALTSDTPQELLIMMTDFNFTTKFAKYSSFGIGDESEGYALKVLGTFSGNAGDSLTQQASNKFSTKDRDNDVSDLNCANRYKGAWWYKSCHASNLNGLYLRGPTDNEQHAQGVVWREWLGHKYSLKTVKMLIRPKVV